MTILTDGEREQVASSDNIGVLNRMEGIEGYFKCSPGGGCSITLV